MAESKPIVIAIIVVSALLLAAVITLITVAAVKSRKRTSKVSMYYRGQGVRMASAKRRSNTSPTAWCIGSFNRVLPGTVSVVQGGTDLQTSQDLRPYISRGDPIKVGPQIFVVSPDKRRPFTPSTLPLDTSPNWISVDGTVHASPGKLLGVSAQHVPVYTCETCELPYNTWTGPRGGAIGYWDAHGKWHTGSCPGKCPQWYSPLFLGENGRQVDGPSPGTLAKVKNKVDPFVASAYVQPPTANPRTDDTPIVPRSDVVMLQPMHAPPPMQPMHAPPPMQPMHAPPPMQPMHAPPPMQPMQPMPPVYAPPPVQAMRPLPPMPPSSHMF